MLSLNHGGKSRGGGTLTTKKRRLPRAHTMRWGKRRFV
jgi:hypothetical protein